ncbi:nudix-type nucleoside diphosphatase, YffH/AdpP family [Methylobacterium phyllostachyos]|uniref:GDP-mannose pyrophosphatase n=1 Tax=Methylobacterium phyllostachyos TaxID=582672 RepID=A0A1G9RLS5_9HYPH|nr:NUDIX hydrolase [Methylobacterium phyllostachyos]SDM24188.1 nudix-type nucleoside diphosphatase, YffH/AdpP family [Methylobacterium phyllostachyos]
MAPRIGGVRLVHDGWARFLVAEVIQEDGTRMTREIEDHGRAVAVLPYDPDRRVATLVSQFRAPVLYSDGPATHLEAPAGLLDEGTPEDEARREAMEETGLRLSALDFIASAWSMSGISTERMDLFLATYGTTDRIGAGGGLAGEGEAVTVHEIPLRDLAAMARDGRLTDMKSLTLLFALQLRRPDLFADVG